MDHEEMLLKWLWNDIPLKYRLGIKLKLYRWSICGKASGEIGIHIWLGIHDKYNYKKFEIWKEY